MGLTCRFYKQKFPEVEDVVMVNVKSIAEMGAYVHLLEYNNIEGMILLSELSRRRIRSINKLIRVGKTEPVVVIRVDKLKGYIDLSKRRVSNEDIEKCTERYAKSKAVSSILRHVADILQYDEPEQLEDLYEKTAWYFEKKFNSKTAAYDIFKQCVTNPTVLNECALEEHTKEVLLSDIKRKLSSQAVKIRADITCACYGYEGIDAVKTALLAGLEVSTESFPVKINLIAPPLYVITTSTPDKVAGIAKLNEAITRVRDTILSLEGVFEVEMAPKVVTTVDDTDLVRRMGQAEVDASGDNSKDNSGSDDDSADENEEGITFELKDDLEILPGQSTVRASQEPQPEN